MSTVVVGADVRDKLLAVGTAEVRDEDGNYLGEFTRQPDRGISMDEMRRRAADTSPGHTPDEVMARLRSLS